MSNQAPADRSTPLMLGHPRPLESRPVLGSSHTCALRGSCFISVSAAPTPVPVYYYFPVKTSSCKLLLSGRVNSRGSQCSSVPHSSRCPVQLIPFTAALSQLRAVSPEEGMELLKSPFERTPRPPLEPRGFQIATLIPTARGDRSCPLARSSTAPARPGGEHEGPRARHPPLLPHARARPATPSTRGAWRPAARPLPARVASAPRLSRQETEPPPGGGGSPAYPRRSAARGTLLTAHARGCALHAAAAGVRDPAGLALVILLLRPFSDRGVTTQPVLAGVIGARVHADCRRNRNGWVLAKASRSDPGLALVLVP